MNKTLTIRATCPFFPGFYATIFDFSDSEYYEAKEMADELNQEHKTDRFTEEMFECDDDKYQHDVAMSYIANIKTKMPGFVKDVQFVNIDSPRYYNFKNDELVVDIELGETWEEDIKKFMTDNHDWLAGRIHDDWSSYDGFMSFMDNDINDWPQHLFDEHDERYIETMIAYILYHDDNKIKDSLLMDTLDDVYIGDYMHLNKEGENLEEELFEEEHQPGWDMTNQTEIPFE